MNNFIDVENNNVDRLKMENSKDELRVILEQMCGCLFEKYLIEKQYEDVVRTSRNPLMTKSNSNKKKSRKTKQI